MTVVENPVKNKLIEIVIVNNKESCSYLYSSATSHCIFHISIMDGGWLLDDETIQLPSRYTHEYRMSQVHSLFSFILFSFFLFFAMVVKATRSDRRFRHTVNCL